MGMDFIGPLKRTKAGNTHILNLICYFSRFGIPFATKAANVEDVIWCLKLAFVMYRKPQAIYCDRGQHFFNDVLKDFLHAEGVAIDFSPSGASKSTGMVEASNRILEEVIRKPSPAEIGMDWDRRLPKGANSTNTRVIHHLGISSQAIIFGQVQEVSATSALLSLPGRDIRSWVQELEDPARHTKAVRQYLTYRADLHDKVRQCSQDQKEKEAAYYNKGIKRATHHVGDLVMLYQKKGKKLEPRWRGPFRITGYGKHGTSFEIQQLGGKAIQGTFHGDHLKQFRPRQGHLASSSDPPLPAYQTIREKI